MVRDVHALRTTTSEFRNLAPHAAITLLVGLLAIQTGFRPEYIAVTAFWGVLTIAGPRAREFLTLSLPVLAVGVLYDKVLPFAAELRPTPHIADLYHAEKAVFGFATAQGRVIPAEWFAQHTSPVLDLATGFGYMAYLYQTFIVAGWMYFVDKEHTLRLTWAFLVANVFGMVCEVVWPAAPPWYVAQYGLGPAHLDAVASPAGCARVDHLLGIHYFSAFYGRSQDVFGAMPSLHVAYPVVVLLAVWNVRRRWGRVATASFVALVAFGAVYLDHHYVLDVIGGALTGVVAYAVVARVRTGRLRRRPTRSEVLAGSRRDA
jgi:inositol phosphorylceramide synthase catalytic subunit